MRIGCCERWMMVASAYRFVVIVTLAVGDTTGVEMRKVFKGKT
ncbi:hypothetical protein [Hoylesella timonensis]|nr:hypothetical protein [Hoylesella timonensis]